MCGSDQNLDAENLAWRAFLNQIHADGLLYCPISGDGPPPNTSYPMFNGILAQALALRTGIDGGRCLDALASTAVGRAKAWDD